MHLFARRLHRVKRDAKEAIGLKCRRAWPALVGDAQAEHSVAKLVDARHEGRSAVDFANNVDPKTLMGGIGVDPDQGIRLSVAIQKDGIVVVVEPVGKGSIGRSKGCSVRLPDDDSPVSVELGERGADGL